MKIAITALAAALGAAFSANAADVALPVKAPPRAVYTAPVSPFYVFGSASAAFTAQQNTLTLPGFTTMGSPKLWPAGALLGGGIGVGVTNSPIGYLGAEFSGDYDFSEASIGCIAGFGCMGNSKNSWRLAQEVLWSPLPTPAQMVGRLPAPVQLDLSRWPVPLVSADTWLSSIMFLPKVGVVEHSLNLCSTDILVTGITTCAQRWMIGPTAGLNIVVPMSANADFRISYNYDWFRTAINSANVPNVPLFTTFQVQNEQVAKAGFNWHW